MNAKLIMALAFVSVMMLRVLEPANAQVTWTYSQTVDNVDFYYSIRECNGDSVVFLKFVNNNDSSVTASWTEVFDTQDGPGQVSHFGPRQLLLSTGVTEQANCSATTCPECLILCEEMMQTHKAFITGFAFDAIYVTP